jgi:competence protein ComFC
VLPQLSKFRGAALNLLFPQRCLGCGEEGEILCRSCLNSALRIMPPICPKCGKPQSSGVLCPRCVNWKTDLDGIRSPFRFDGVIREAIHQFKYKNIRTLSAPLANLLKDYYFLNSIPTQALVPVPLHSKRLKERGYNQAELLAQELGKLLHFPVIIDCLVRDSYILPQAKTSSAEERHKNVKDAFSCRSSKLTGIQVLLIDDVSTSGSTLDACAAALKSSGVVSTWGLVIAREL